jgi:signal peptidase
MLRKFAYLLTVGVFIVWFIGFRPLFLGGPASYIIISGISMEPTLYTGDLAILQRQASYQPGDVIAYTVSGGQVIHRVIEVIPGGYRTLGDNKQQIDPWTPTDETILGKMWFHIPGAGVVLNNFRQPVPLLALALLGLFMIQDDPTDKRRHQKRGKKVKSNHANPGLRYFPAESLMQALGIAAVLFCALALFAFRQPVAKPEAIDRLTYQHQGAFQYTIHTEPSQLYPGGLIGPVNTAPPVVEEEGEAPRLPTVFTSLAKTLDLDFTYHLQSSLPVDMHGEVSARVTTRVGGIWSKDTVVVAPQPFNGGDAELSLSIDFAQFQAIVDSVNRETGMNAETYQIEIIPVVEVAGVAGDVALVDVFEPVFSIKVNQEQLVFDSPLAQTQDGAVPGVVMLPNRVQVLSFGFPVSTLRMVGLFGGLLTLLLTGALAAYLYLDLGRSPADVLRARYGGMIVSVTSTDLLDRSKVQVASMTDLVRLAQRDGQVILYQRLADGTQLFFVPEDEAVYTYPVSEET